MDEYDFEISGLQLKEGKLSGRMSVRMVQIPTPIPPIPPPPIGEDFGGYRPQLYTSNGMDTKGGRGPGSGVVPVIIKVNSLLDTRVALTGPTGTGTLSNPFVYTGELGSALVLNAPAKFIVFEVSGYITLNSRINVMNPYVTVAGQTSPRGITIRTSAGFGANLYKAIQIGTSHTVFQHLAIRPGDTGCNSALIYWNFDNAANIVENNLIDHCSISWEQDEGISLSSPAGFTTIWRSIIAESLDRLPGSEVCTGGGIDNGHGISSGRGFKLAILQNLLAHNFYRNPQVDGDSTGAIQNNIEYGCRQGAWFNTQPGTGPFKWRCDGNYFKRDSINPGTTITAIRATGAVTGAQLYLNDNIFDNGPVIPAFTQFAFNNGIDPRVGTPPSQSNIINYTPLTAQATYEFVLTNAGARPLNRDMIDTRIVNNVRNRTGTIINSINLVGGYPTLPTDTAAFNIPSDPFTVIDAFGRTKLEKVLEDQARVLEP